MEGWEERKEIICAHVQCSGSSAQAQGRKGCPKRKAGFGNKEKSSAWVGALPIPIVAVLCMLTCFSGGEDGPSKEMHLVTLKYLLVVLH